MSLVDRAKVIEALRRARVTHSQDAALSALSDAIATIEKLPASTCTTVGDRGISGSGGRPGGSPGGSVEGRPVATFGSADPVERADPFPALALPRVLDDETRQIVMAWLADVRAWADRRATLTLTAARLGMTPAGLATAAPAPAEAPHGARRDPVKVYVCLDQATRQVVAIVSSFELSVQLSQVRPCDVLELELDALPDGLRVLTQEDVDQMRRPR